MTHLTAVDYSSFGKIKVLGKDALPVLQNILTQDIKKIPVGASAPAALLTHTGKFLLYLEVFRFADYFILVLENLPASKGIPLIDKYIITEDVQLEDVTSQYSFFWVYGNRVEKILCPATESNVLLNKSNRVSAHTDEAEALRISTGIPLYGVDMNEETILSETGLETAAVSGTKGCYPGQEVIARIETYKGLTKKLRLILLEGDILPRAGDKIHTEDGTTEIGWVTSTSKIPPLNKIQALGYFKKGFFEKDSDVMIFSGEKQLRGNSNSAWHH